MNITTIPTIQLQGYGTVTARAYGDLLPGDVTIYNYGYKYHVLSVEPVGKASVRITEQNVKTGRVSTSTKRRTRLIGWTEIYSSDYQG